MLKQEDIIETNKDYHQIFNGIAGIRIIFLIIAVFNSTIELGLSLSIVKVEDAVSSIIVGLLIATIINILLLLVYLKTVKQKNNQSSFLIYIIEVLTAVYGILGLCGYIGYIQQVEVITVMVMIGMIGLVDLIIVNIFIGSFFINGKVSGRLIEYAILINALVLILLMFI